MKKIFLIFILAFFLTSPLAAETIAKISNSDVPDATDSDNVSLQDASGKPTAEEIKYDHDSDDCYNSAQATLKLGGKPVGGVSKDSPDPKSEILDRFYSECMQKKGYSLEEKSDEGEEEE